jgi:small subunit ribosomal protein S16
VGPRSRPTYRVVIIDSRKARDGEYLESVGNYDPRTKLLALNQPRIEHWIGQGAQPSDTVKRLFGRYRRMHAPAPEPAPAPAEPVPPVENAQPTESPN